MDMNLVDYEWHISITKNNAKISGIFLSLKIIQNNAKIAYTHGRL